jgi:hypothetical protein
MEDICSICLEPTKHTLTCRHLNCIPCLKQLVRKSNICPICRTTFDITPYKYKAPKHTPNLKINKNTIKFFNKFLLSRYLLVSNKHQKFYANLMSAYHDYIYVHGKYVNPNTVCKMNKYECLQMYVYFKSKNNIFHHQVKMEMCYAIEMYLCCQELLAYTSLLFSTFP